MVALDPESFRKTWQPAASAAGAQATMDLVLLMEKTARSRIRVDPRFAWLRRFVKALTCSMLGTVISQIALLGLLAVATNPTIASTAAFVAGSIPNYFVSRRWAWGRDRKPDLRTELLPYIAVVACTGLLAVGLTTLTDHLLEPLGLSGALRVALLDAAYVGSYGLVFVLKFTLLDRIVFGSGGVTSEAVCARDDRPGVPYDAGRTREATSPS